MNNIDHLNLPITSDGMEQMSYRNIAFTYNVFDSNHIVAFDVDDTLVMWENESLSPGLGKLEFKSVDKTFYLKPHGYHIHLLKSYKPRGFKVIVWSAAGVEWAEEVVKKLGLEKDVDMIMSKINLFYDDLPPEKVLGTHLYFHNKLENEAWKPIKGFEHSEVSNLGRIRTKTKSGEFFIKEQSINIGGYPTVILKDTNKKGKLLSTHRLVAEEFCDKTSVNDDIVHHIDNNKMNNHYLNLKWATYSENNQSRKKQRFSSEQLQGNNNPSSKLTETEVKEIYLNLNSNSIKELANKYNVTTTQIYYIKNKKSWKSFTDKLDLQTK